MQEGTVIFCQERGIEGFFLNALGLHGRLWQGDISWNTAGGGRVGGAAGAGFRQRRR